MDTFLFIMLIEFLSALSYMGLIFVLTVTEPFVNKWLGGNLFKRTKSLKHPTKVGEDTLQLESDDIFRRHEEAYIASLKNTDKGNNK